MGVMHSLAPVTEQPPLILTPCPVTLDGQQFIPAEIRPGETLGQFLDRSVDLGADAWEVKIGGVVVPVEMWDRVKPKHGHLIEVRGAVRKQALYWVAMIALMYFTGGLGGAWGAAGGVGGAFGAGTVAAFAVNAAVFIAGAMIINKVLGPKVDKPAAQDRDSVYSIAGARNALRLHEPLGLLLGSTRIAPDILSQPYSYYRGNDQYLAMVLTPGINVDRFDQLYFGDTPLSSYQGVQVWTAGFPGMPEQDIPVFTNADTVPGGELTSAGGWVVRTTPPDTVRVMVNIEYLMFGVGTSGKAYDVAERVDVEYRPAGSTGGWTQLNTRIYRSRKQDTRRDTIQGLVDRGQYDIRVRIAGLGNYEGPNTQENRFTWSTLVSVQADDADYRGIPRIGVEIKATGQLSGTPDQIRAVFHAADMPVWTGTEWITATGRQLANPGAQILAYARGFEDENGDLIAGMGLDDGMIDIPALQAFMLHCAANGYTYDHWQQGVRSHHEMLDAIALAGFGQVTWAGGRLSVTWAASGQPLTGVVNMATMKRGQFQVDYNLAGGADGIEFTYYDRDTWQTATLRVPAPGVTTMLNPARLTGEGITSEAHAARMARYHLAQSLYQFKDISYSTDLEHLSYRRMSVLALQHDMTKWGAGGRLRGVSVVGGVASVALDEPVQAPATGKAYIGLRIPGEAVYRVFEVAAFTGESDTLTLVDPWPVDAAIPGSTADNPAHDTIWIYDFKATPGYRVRVTSIEPEGGLKGARVSVVPEGPEFWTYVETGHYEPPVANPPGNNRPIASNLVISENQILYGNVESTELTATFDITGHVSHSVVYAGLIGQPLEEVAQTTTRTATWRIDQPGEYAILVRPFDVDGNAGDPVSTTYITARAETPPTLFDIFEVNELPGGVRQYLWGYYSTTMQPANLAGAEIRYIAGLTGAPVWEDMTPLGEGFFTSGFEMVIPPAGEWTFAIRARNTSGILSTTMKVVAKTLSLNLGGVLEDIMDEQTRIQQELDQEILDRISGDLQLASDLDVARDQIDALSAQVAEILEVEEWDSGTAYDEGTLVQSAGKLYRAKINVPAGTPLSNTTYWHLVGEYSSLGEAVAAALAASTVNASDISALSSQMSLVVADLDDTQALVGTVNTASVNRDNALSSRATVLEARMPAGSGTLATSAQVLSEQTARVNADNALAQDVSQINVTLGDQSASLTQLAQISASAASGNAVANPSFEDGETGWIFSTTSASIYNDLGFTGSKSLRLNGNVSNTYAMNRDFIPVMVGQTIRLGMHVRSVGSAPNAGSLCRINVRWYDAAKSQIASVGTNCTYTANGSTFGFVKLRGSIVVPSNAAYMRVTPITTATSGGFLVDDVLAEVMTEGETQFLASHTIALDVNGKISGTVNQNDGIRSEFSILADVFRVLGATAEGMEWQNGYLRVYGTGYQRIIGHNFGAAGEGLVDWFGPNIGPGNCNRANGLFWLAKDGTGYFAGDILQGVLRAFNSSTAVSTTATVATGVVGTKNKSVAVRGEVDYQNVQNYMGGSSVITLGNGSTGVDVYLERRYRNTAETGWDAWVTLSTRRIVGGDDVFNEAASPSTITQTIRGSIAATDAASLRRREYRIRLANLTLRSHTVTNPGTTPAPMINQYQSIESME